MLYFSSTLAGCPNLNNFNSLFSAQSANLATRLSTAATSKMKTSKNVKLWFYQCWMVHITILFAFFAPTDVQLQQSGRKTSIIYFLKKKITVVVFPVPGGPCIMNASDDCNATRTASCCDSFNVESKNCKFSVVLASAKKLTEQIREQIKTKVVPWLLLIKRYFGNRSISNNSGQSLQNQF